ncbi:MAG: hypothetical protein E6767_12590 [Dysgonomonas sp.]|nr:hypothetical protein [Dysgonomonas sp.]
MKSKNLLYSYMSVLVIAFGMFFTSCDGDDKEPLLSPSVTLEKIITTSSDKFTVVFQPNEVTTRYVYAIGDEANRDAFIAGTYSGIKEVEGRAENTVIFQGLEENSVYTVFARAYDADGTAGPIASVKVKTRKPLNDFETERQYLTSNAVAFTIKSSTEYYKYVFGLGKDGDIIDFEEGTLEGMLTKEEISQYTASYFNLEANTEYVFFVKAYDRLSDEPTETKEIKIKTAGRNEAPEVSFNIDYIDIYNGDYSFTPNDKCGKISVFVAREGEHEDLINNEIYWKGDILTMANRWTEANNGLVTIGYGGTLKMSHLTPKLLLGELDPFNHPMEAYVLIYDKDNKPFAIQRFKFKTPAYNDNAGVADVELTISNITSEGAFYEFYPNEHALGLVYQTFDAEWVEELKTSSEYYDGYIEDFLHLDGYWAYCYGAITPTFPERTAEADKEYYVYYMVMNSNGPSGGWSKLKRSIFKTLPKKD